MTAFECYQTYLALKNHFSRPTYDYFKYQGKTGVKSTTFDKRKDKVFFQKLAKHPDYKNFLLANLVRNEKAWIREIAYSEEAEKVYLSWNKHQQALSYNFKTELGQLSPNFDENFVCVDGEHPILMRKYLAGEVSLETLCMLLKLTGASNHWNKCMEYDIVWETMRLKIEKYTPFLTYDEGKIKQIVVDFFVD